jgi:hypothetical protein
VRQFPPVADATELAAQLRELVAAQERWLAAARDLLAAHEIAPAAVPPPPPFAGPLGVSAGPFAGTEALRRFERALAALPEVREVVLREYAGDDHVVVDVHLIESIS